MPDFDDLIGKYILAAALDGQGVGLPEKEIPLLSPQAADFAFAPGPGPRHAEPVFHWLNVVTAVTCLLELYSGTPALVPFLRGPLRKHLEHFHNCCVEAERNKQQVPKIQAMWLLCSGRPQQVFAELGHRPIADAPDGFYRVSGPSVGLSVVVLPELPRRRDTLVLRMLGAPHLRQEAIAEIHQIPADDPDGQALRSLLSCVQVIIDRDPRIPRQKKEEFMLAIKEEFEKFKQGVRAEGHFEGLKEGRSESKADAVCRVLKLRGIALSDEERQRILGCTDLALLDTWLDRAIVAQSADDVLRPAV